MFMYRTLPSGVTVTVTVTDTVTVNRSLYLTLTIHGHHTSVSIRPFTSNILTNKHNIRKQ